MADYSVVNPSINPAVNYNDLLGWSYEPEDATATELLAPGTLYVSRIPILNGILITNVLSFITVISITASHAYNTVHNSAGVLLGQSSDQSGIINATTGPLIAALAGGPFPVSPLQNNDFIFAGVYVGAAGTGPTLAASAAIPAGLINVGTSTSRRRQATTGIGNVTTVPNFTPSALTPANNNPWVGIS